jgi:hypothetical protein
MNALLAQLDVTHVREIKPDVLLAKEVISM